MYCSKCGSELPDVSIVCYLCATPTAKSPPLVQNQPMVVINKSSGLGSFFAGLFFLVILGGLVFCGFRLYQRHLENQKVAGIEINKSGEIKVKLPELGWSNETGKKIPVSTPQTPSIDYSANTVTENYQASTYTPQLSRPNYCYTSNGGKTVNFRKDCDTRDCLNDHTTIYGQFDDNQRFDVANVPLLDSGAGFSWIPVEFDGSVLYAASSKLDCKF